MFVSVQKIQNLFRGNVKKSAYLKTLSKQVGGWSSLFKKILMNFFLTLGGGKSLFTNADPTYFG